MQGAASQQGERGGVGTSFHHNAAASTADRHGGGMLGAAIDAHRGCHPHCLTVQPAAAAAFPRTCISRLALGDHREETLGATAWHQRGFVTKILDCRESNLTISTTLHGNNLHETRLSRAFWAEDVASAARTMEEIIDHRNRTGTSCVFSLRCLILCSCSSVNGRDTCNVNLQCALRRSSDRWLRELTSMFQKGGPGAKTARAGKSSLIG